MNLTRPFILLLIVIAHMLSAGALHADSNVYSSDSDYLKKLDEAYLIQRKVDKGRSTKSAAIISANFENRVKKVLYSTKNDLGGVKVNKDGTYLAFYEYKMNARTISILEINSKNIVWEDSSALYLLGWSGDGNILSYVGLEGGKSFIKEYSLSSQKTRKAKFSGHIYLAKWDNKCNCFYYMYADRKSTRLNSSHTDISRMPSSA